MLKTLIIFSIILTFGCIKTDNEYLIIGTNVWPGYEFLYLAREIGYYKNKPIHLVEYSSSSQVLRAYRNNILNGAALTLDEVLLLKSYGYNPKIVLVMDISNGADVIIAKSQIKSIKDLKGKKIGVENTALGSYVLVRALEKNGLSEKEITIVPLEVDEHYKAFINGEVDAVVTFEPVKSKLLQAGGHIIFDSSQIPGEIVDVLVIEESFLKKNPEIVKVLIKGWFLGIDFWKEKENTALKIISQREHISVEQLKAAYKGLLIPDRLENLELLNNENPKLLKVAKKLKKIMEKKNILLENTSFKVEELFLKKDLKKFY
jgi:NitT/TauT family transport system substrate-binding protein